MTYSKELLSLHCERKQLKTKAMRCNMIYKANGIRYTEKGVAMRMRENFIEIDRYPKERIKKQAEWICENFTNLNDIALENALEYYWHNVVEISSNAIWNEIHEEATRLVENGTIKEW